MVLEDPNGTNIRFKCDDCGHFIAFNDILTGTAIHRIVTPESLVTHESFETLCKDCK